MVLRRNIAANMVGRVWVGAMGFLFVPQYIHWLGMEAFGLIGLSATLMAIFAMLDLGLSTAINREFAHRAGDDSVVAQTDARNLLRSFEIIYWAMGAVIAAVVVSAAPMIASHWLRVKSLDTATTIAAIRFIGITIFFRWPVSLYTGALLGLGRQVSLNVVSSLYATLQGAGILLIFYLFRPGVDLFFVWQALVAMLQVVLLSRATWVSLGQSEGRAQFSPAALRAVLNFSAGVMGITLLSIALTQLDKVMLTRILPLREFGYYALAGSIASILNLAAAAINSAVFPALSQIVRANDQQALAQLYHRSCQYLAVVLIPPGLVLAIFAREVLSLYVNDPLVVGKTYPVLSVLALGNLILGLMVLPFSLQLAHGWTKLSLYKNIVAVVLFVPAMLLMINSFGMIGAALTWLLLTIGYFCIEIAVMHRRLLRGEMLRWYTQDTTIPMAAAAAVLLIGKLIFPEQSSAIVRLVSLGAIGIAAVFAAVLSVRDVRQPFLLRLHFIFGGQIV